MPKTATPQAFVPHILLVEPQFVLRRTIIAVSRDLGVAQLVEATNADTAAAKLATMRFDGLVLAVDEGSAAFTLMSRIRQGHFASNNDIPIIVLTSHVKEMIGKRLEPFGLLATLCKPFKVAALLQAMQQMTRVAA